MLSGYDSLFQRFLVKTIKIITIISFMNFFFFFVSHAVTAHTTLRSLSPCGPLVGPESGEGSPAKLDQVQDFC